MLTWQWPVLGSLALLFSLALVAWLAHGWAIGVPLLTAWAVVWLIVLHLPVKRRQQHAVSLLTMFLWALLWALGLAWFEDRYAAWAASLNAQYAVLLQWLQLQLPPTLSEAVPLLNALFLASCVLLKAPLIGALRLTDASGGAWAHALYEPAYRLRGAEWKLRPWWIQLRHYGAVLFLLGLLGFAYAGWRLVDGPPLPWLPLLLVALAPIGIEWHWWLSGALDESLEPALGGSDHEPKPQADFEDLWVRYRQRWPGQWRAAGNRVMDPPNG